ncbi:MAG TPA: DUF885 family protein, partial [Terriglobales bacterium]|nr:DUF885 family protein [Terriglobales bacterium]
MKTISILLLITLSLPAQTKLAPKKIAGQPEPSKILNALIAAEWEHTMQESPEWASQLGDRRFNDRWSDLSLENFAREARRNADVLQQLAAIDRTRLAPADRLNYDLFKRQYEVALDEYKFKSY